MILVAVTLGGCVTDRVVSRQLPPGDNVVLDPVPAPLVRPGDDARIAWKKEQAARREANGRLVRSREIYEGVRETYEGR